MDTNLKQICRLCFESSAKLVNVFESFEDSTIASVLAQHFWFKVFKNDGISENVCEICWTNVKTFHRFYKRVEWLHGKHSANLVTTKMDSLFPVTQQEQSGSASSIPDLNIVKCEETDLVFEVTAMQMKNEENSDNNDEYNREQSENASHYSNVDDQFSNKRREDESPISEIDCKISNGEGANEVQSHYGNDRAIEDAQIREFFDLKCNICNEDVKFDTFKEFKQHYREVHNLNGSLKCCGRMFIHRSGVLQHIFSNHIKSDADIAKQNAQIREFITLKCNICTGDVKYDTLKEFKKHHRQVHNASGQLECCGTTLTQRYEVLKHIRARHLNQDTERAKQDAQIREYFTMKCNDCNNDVNFDTFTEFRRHHMDVHKTKGYLKCCGRKFDKRCKALTHINHHLNPDAYRCDPCGKQFHDHLALKYHIANHAPKDRAYKCDQCKKSYTTAVTLKQHIVYKHSSKNGETFSCDICKKHYPTKFSLETHIRFVHSAATFVCDTCARVFKTKANFLNHMEEHSTRTRPKMQCNVCGAWLKNEANLRKHLKQHDESDHLKCPICAKVVRNKHSLNGHVRSAHGERCHQCTLCDKSFKTAKSLKEHIAVHTGEDLYDCGYCYIKFKSSANAHSHRKKAHFNEWTRDRLRRKGPQAEKTISKN